MADRIETTEPLAGKAAEQASHRMLAETGEQQSGHVTGIGGVFFRSHGDPKVLNDWYEKNLGMSFTSNDDETYALMRWSGDKGNDGGTTAWRTVKDTAGWFSPSKSDFMIDYRVDSMDKVFERLSENKMLECNQQKSADCILKEPENTPFGKFAYLLDPDGNKVELWEPNIQPEKK